MIPFARILEYGNKGKTSFHGDISNLSPSGYRPPGRNNTCSCSVDTIEYPRVYFYGGLSDTNTYLNDLFYYDLVKNEFVYIGPMGSQLRGSSLVYNNGYVYAFGGANSANQASNQFFKINVETNNIQIISGDSNRPTGKYNQSALSHGNYLYYFSGGSSVDRKTIIRYDTVNNIWNVIANNNPSLPDIIGGEGAINYKDTLYIVAGDGLYIFNTFTYEVTKLEKQPPGYNTLGYSIIVMDELYYISSMGVVSKYVDGDWLLINNKNIGYTIYTTWKGYNSKLSYAILAFGGEPNEKSNLVRKLT